MSIRVKVPLLFLVSVEKSGGAGVVAAAAGRSTREPENVATAGLRMTPPPPVGLVLIDWSPYNVQPAPKGLLDSLSSKALPV